MKHLSNISSMILVLALLLFNSVGFAGNEGLPDVEFKKLLNDIKRVSVQINNLKREATIRILDQARHELMEIVIPATEPKAVKVFNLEDLSEGAYFFLVSTGQKETLQPFEVTLEDIIIRADDRQVYLVPTIRIGEGFVDVNWFNNRIADMSVQILSPGGATVFSDEIREVLKVERRYNLAQLERGEYMVVVSTPNKTQYQSLMIK